MSRRSPFALAALLICAPRLSHAADPPSSAFPPAPSASASSAPPAALPSAEPPAAEATPPAPASAPPAPAPSPPVQAAPAQPARTLDSTAPEPTPDSPGRYPVDVDVATPSPAKAKRPVRARFFGSLGLGPGVFTASSGAVGDERSFLGGTVSGRFAIASMTKKMVAIGAAYSHDAVYALSSEDELIDGDEPDLKDVSFSLSLLAFYLDFYIKDGPGPHLEILLGVASLNASRDHGPDIRNPTGLAGSIGAGYDFKMGEKTTLGAVLRLVYAPLSVNESNATSVATAVPALLFTGSTY